MSRIRVVVIGLLGLMLLAASGSAFTVEAQLRDRLKRAAQRAAEREVTRQIDRTVTGMVRCALNDPSCIEEAKKNGDSVELTDEDGNVLTDANGNPISDPDYAESSRRKPGEGAWANYDFVPGERALFTEDYTADNVGDFPRRLEFITGNMEIVDDSGLRVIRATAGSSFAIPLGETLPERFTIEVPVHWGHTSLSMRVLFTEVEGKRVAPRQLGWYTAPHLYVRSVETGIEDIQDDSPTSLTAAPQVKDGWAVIRLMADGEHVKVYVNEKRVANVPQVELGRASKIWFSLRDASPEWPMFVGPIAVAAGGRDLYQRLEAEGSVTTRGILFDTDSDRLRPESTPTLEEIGGMLRDHPDLRLRITGHTDSQGNDDYNLNLSEQRARAVKAYLQDEFDIDSDRLETVGKGESEPVDSNDTAEGRASNRRVELTDLRSGSGEASGPSDSNSPSVAASSADLGAPASAPRGGAEDGATRRGSIVTGPAIGYLELPGVERIDVPAAAAGATRDDVLDPAMDGHLTPSAAWIEGQNRLVVVAARERGPANAQPWVHMDLSFRPDGQGKATIHPTSVGIAYHEPTTSRYPPRLQLPVTAVTVERVAQAADGTWSVHFSFDGTATRVVTSDSGRARAAGEAPMSGMLRLDGIPVVANREE